MPARSRSWIVGLLVATAVGALAPGVGAQRRRRVTCEAPQHASAGRCCNPGEEWVEARNACVCLDPGGCRPPPPPAPPEAPAPTVTAPPPPAPPAFRCAEGMAMVQGSAFMMGAIAGQDGATPIEGPPHRVTLAAYCIDRTEVTVRQYRECVQSGACTVFSTVNHPALSPADTQFFSQFCNGARNDRDTHPMNCVDFAQAEAYCRSRGGALPTEAQWELAARGTEPRRFPWDDRAPSAQLVNGCDAECQSLADRPGQARRAALFMGTDGFASTAPVGTYLGGSSPFGLLDAAGNVAEWTADWFGPYTAAPVSDPMGPTSGNGHVVRGGDWYANAVQRFTTTVRAEVPPTVRLATLGFRCVHAPEAAPPPPPPPPPIEPPPPETNRRRRRR